MAYAAGQALRLLGLLLCQVLCYLASESASASALPLALPRSPAFHLSGHALILNITITAMPRPGQPWCEAQVRVDREPCFYFDCQNDEVKPFCVLGMKVEAPLRQQIRDILKDLTAEFREKLLDFKPKNLPSGEPLSLQAMMVMQEKARVLIRGSWQFVINGHISLRLNLVNKTWALDHPGDTGMLEKWEEDRDMNKFLWRMSHGDCRRWLRQVTDYREMLGITVMLKEEPERVNFCARPPLTSFLSSVAPVEASDFAVNIDPCKEVLMQQTPQLSSPEAC